MKTHRNIFSPITSFWHIGLFCAVGLITSTVSCSIEVGTDPGTRTAFVIEQLTPTAVEANAGSIVQPSPSIRLKAMNTGVHAVSSRLEFRGCPRTGSVEPPFTTTHSSGFATAGLWQVGTSPGSFALLV